MVPRAMFNALYLFAISWTGSQMLALTLALAINGLQRGVGMFRTLYYIPIVTSIVTVATIFRWLFGGDPTSPMNQLLAVIGVSPVRWLWDERLVIPIIGGISIWAGLGFNIVIYTAGLKGIPVEYYEAARIDGASGWRQFWSITAPLLKPVFIFMAVTGFIGGMKEFGLVLVMTQGGPSGASTTPVLMIYKYGFERLQMGYASALAWLLSAFLLIATIFQLRVFGRSTTFE
jgi:putative chitobiose transport system permease protein